MQANDFFQLVKFTSDIRVISVVTIIIIYHLIYMFVLNYVGQELMNHGLHFFKVSYNGLWYAAPLHTQKLLLFIMQRGTINIVFVCGRIYVASLEGFATLISTAVSYFTVIYSTR
ncbi:odorant receptor 4-like [Mycetomoellerius zeteki]|uniref:odorant receptor 4-like n=1 Tax=Mycetomoellerius zeteki TaxID=64791 RepID=UPI00084E633A|nr:PREDICTED: odorant receptor 4-like [Trachymyrmex zeteki]